MKRTLIASSILLATSAVHADGPSFELTGWAEIPSTYRHPGPVSGQFAFAANGVTPPYAGQPIPGFSGMIATATAGRYYGLPDNGFGAQGNSADFVLGFYTVTPSFKTTGDGTTSRGPVSVDSFTPFSDPNGLLSADYITNGPVYSRTNYYPSGNAIAVDPAISNARLLTGADFDIESFTQMADGSFWVGEEFGPYLLHFDNAGRLTTAPVRHPSLRAPQNPQNATLGAANLPSSRGFEAMTSNADGSRLYLTTEASVVSEVDKRMIEIYEFDTVTAEYTGTVLKYAKDSSDLITGAVNNATNIFVTGDMAHVADDRYLIIERDDLLNIADPQDIGGPLVGIADDRFNFPLQSVESLTLVDPFTLLVGLDNNYPGGNGRVPGLPDGTEIITLRFNVPLADVPVPLPPALLLFGSAAGLLGFRRRR